MTLKGSRALENVEHLNDVENLKDVEHLNDVENLKDQRCRPSKGCRADSAFPFASSHSKLDFQRLVKDYSQLYTLENLDQ